MRSLLTVCVIFCTLIGDVNAQSTSARAASVNVESVADEISSVKSALQTRINDLSRLRTAMKTCGRKRRVYDLAGRDVDEDGCSLIAEEDNLALRFAKEGVSPCTEGEFLFPISRTEFSCVDMDEIRERLTE